jgi:hypothetical protein
MPSKARKTPAYRLHKPTGQAVVRLKGKDHYLGRHDLPGSHERYNRVIADWHARDCAPEPVRTSSPDAGAETGPSVAAEILAFWSSWT